MIPATGWTGCLKPIAATDVSGNEQCRAPGAPMSTFAISIGCTSWSLTMQRSNKRDAWRRARGDLQKRRRWIRRERRLRRGP
jgi:hypothetical protein